MGGPAEFVRTPKLGVLLSGDSWRQKRYRGQANRAAYLELALAFYLAAMAVYAITHDQWGTAPFVLIFLAGYLYVAALSLIQEIGRPGVAAALET